MALRYPALIDGQAGAYGVVFPDIDGAVAMGDNIEQALVNAEEALRDYALEVERDGGQMPAPTPMEEVAAPHGSTLTSIPLIRISGKPVRANMMLDEDVLNFIDAESRRRAMTRTSYINWMTRRIAQMGG